jgi:hypothetical protein
MRLMKDRYRKLKELLLEDGKTMDIITCMYPSPRITLWNLLTPIDVHRMPFNVNICTSDRTITTSCSEHLFLLGPYIDS